MQGPLALLLLNNEAALGWRGLDEARRALQLQRRRLGWALDACRLRLRSLLARLGRGLHRLLPHEPVDAVEALQARLDRAPFLGVELVLGRPDPVLDHLDGRDHAVEADPLESRLAAVEHLGLVNQADRLEHVGDVVESADFGLQELLVEHFAIGDLLGGLLERQHILPCHEQTDELLAKVAERLDFFVLGRFLISSCIGTLSTFARRVLMLVIGRASTLRAHHFSLAVDSLWVILVVGPLLALFCHIDVLAVWNNFFHFAILKFFLLQHRNKAILVK